MFDSSASGPSRRHRGWFAVATFVSAFLIFQVQPVISKCVLPWYGGTPAVWTTCLLFFQVLLLGGYVYAHLLKTHLPSRIQGAVHLALMAAALVSLPIEPSEHWRPTGGESPMQSLVTILAVHIALPYFMLSSTGPLLQAWLAGSSKNVKPEDPGAGEDSSVYRLYALSNIGSLAALLSYPFFVEPYLSTTAQSTLWSLGYSTFVLINGWIAISLLVGNRSLSGSTASTDADVRQTNAVPATAPVPWSHRVAWIVYPAIASGALLVVTTHLCTDIAVIPFLWVVPLSLYLISFIVTFDSPQWYRPKWVGLILISSIVAACLMPSEWNSSMASIVGDGLASLTLLTALCVLCHGEVVRYKPATRRLTQFYMSLSAGGAVGGLVVALGCPAVFNYHWEWPLVGMMATGLGAHGFLATSRWSSTAMTRSIGKPGWAIVSTGVVGVVLNMGYFGKGLENDVYADRNFFGALRVVSLGPQTQLVHGRTIHGTQWAGDRANEPTTYYGPESGVGRVLGAMAGHNPSGADQPIHVGVVGLGCGVLACYGRPGDQYEFYEINPAVQTIAENYFTYLRDSPAKIRHHIGDGRLMLQRQRDKTFDVLVLDAFSSDAIPVHLLTTEAMRVYTDRLGLGQSRVDDGAVPTESGTVSIANNAVPTQSTGGVLLVHVTNNYLDLTGLVHRLARHSGLRSTVIKDDGQQTEISTPSTWLIIAAANHDIWDSAAVEGAIDPDPAALQGAPLWTDQKHHLSSVISWSQS